jgi:hypothetical protein
VVAACAVEVRVDNKAAIKNKAFTPRSCWVLDGEARILCF